MTRTHWGILLGIIAAGLLLRLGLLPMIDNPGLFDQNHYYNVAERLLAGEGLTIDYVWHYSSLPEDIVHPIDHWMPLTALVTAAGMALGGVTPQAALIFFVLAGATLPLLVVAFARELDFSPEAALSAAALVAFLPDVVWNSLRTDTTILSMWLVGGSIWLMIRGGKRGALWAFAVSGVLAGLAYLNRNDALVLLPLLLGWLLTHRLFYKHAGLSRLSMPQYMAAFALFGLGLSLTIAPWLWRNWQLFGRVGTPESSRMFFMTSTFDHYAYGIDLTLETLLQRQTVTQLITKRLFELAAALKQILISLESVLAALVTVGAGWLLYQREWRRGVLASPLLLWMLGILVAYPILLPYKSQSGSFEKAYLSVLPLLVPLAGYALVTLVAQPLARRGFVVITVTILAATSFDVVRLETARANDYYAMTATLLAEVKSLPDVTGDDELRLMTQDPYVFSYLGIKSIMTPLASRDDTLALADRYAIDYLLLPAARPALDPLFDAPDADPRFVHALDVQVANQRIKKFYALLPESDASDADTE